MNSHCQKGLPTIVHTESSLGWGGQEIRIMTELQAFKKLGFKTVLIAPENSHIYLRARSSNIEAYAVPFRSKATISTWINIFNVLKRIRPDILNTHSSDDAWIAGIIGRLLRLKLIIRTRHVSTPIGSPFSYKKLSDLIITTSGFTKTNLIHAGIESHKIHVVPTGIDAKKFSFKESNRSYIRKLLGIQEDSILVGNICVLRSWKGLDFFIEVASKLPSKFRFVLVGDGPQRKRLEEKARQLCSHNPILFLGHSEEAHRYFSALDVFFFTSFKNEGIPQSLLQARANGLFILTVHTDPALEALKGYHFFQTVNYGDIDGAMRIIAETLCKASLPSFSQRSKSYEWVKQNYSIKCMLKRLLRIYKEAGITFPDCTTSHLNTLEDQDRPSPFC